MLKKSKWFWEIYFILFVVFSLKSAVDFFSPRSNIYFFYYFLCAFNKGFFFNYIFNLLQIIFNLIFCYILGAYVYNIVWLKPKVWQWIFTFKIIFDILGHSYDYQFILSLLHYDRDIAGLIILQGLAFQWPSYIAGYQYAFRKK